MQTLEDAMGHCKRWNVKSRQVADSAVLRAESSGCASSATTRAPNIDASGASSDWSVKLMCQSQSSQLMVMFEGKFFFDFSSFQPLLIVRIVIMTNGAFTIVIVTVVY